MKTGHVYGFAGLLCLTHGCVGSSSPSEESGGAAVDSQADTASETGSEDSGEPVEVFELEVQTEPSGDSLMLRTNLPSGVAECEGLPLRDVPCEDLDLDGLVDAWEDLVLDRMRPTVRFDEEEPLMSDEEAVLHAVGRVALASDGSARIRVYVMIGYSKDYGRCGLLAHDGDSERVVLDLSLIGDATAGDASVERLYTAAHEGTEVDHGTLLEGSELSQAEFPIDAATGEPRWLVYASDGKHATYPSVDLCESAEWVPCLDEDCEPDGVDEPLDFERLPAIVNAGEEDAPLLSDLSEIGFPDEDAWLDQPFCGGQGRDTSCSSSVRQKLLEDPFD